MAHEVLEPSDRRYAALIRGVTCGGGILGIILFARKTRMFARYERVADVPLEVYKKEIQLKGIVRAVHSNGYMKVEHIPAFTMPKFLSRRRPIQPGLLDVRLAGIDVSDAGSEYLAKDLRLRSSQILFSAIKPVENNNCIDAEVYLRKKRFLQTNLNVDLVRRGFARVISLTNPEHLETLKTSYPYARLISKLILSEKIANRRGLGLWTRDTWAETIFSYPAAFRQIIISAGITRFLVAAAVVAKEMAVRGSHLSKQAVSVIIVLYQKICIIMQQFAGVSFRLSNVMKKRIDKFSSK